MDEILCSMSSAWWFSCKKMNSFVNVKKCNWNMDLNGRAFSASILHQTYLFNELVSIIFNVLNSLAVNFQISLESFVLLQETLYKSDTILENYSINFTQTY